MQDKIEMQGNECYASVTSPKNKEHQPKDVKLSKHIKLLYVVVAVLTVMVIGACACIVAAFVEISKLHSEVEMLQQPSVAMTANVVNVNQNALLENITNFCNATFLEHSQLLNGTYGMRFNHLSGNISDLSSALATIANNFAEELMNHSTAITQIANDVQLFHPFFNSCATIPPLWPSAYYWVVSFNGSAMRVYCDMTRSCGGMTGGWMRVAALNMRNSRAQCPNSLEEMTYSGNIRTCIKRNESFGCSSDIDYATYGILYSHVCGMIRGYQIDSPDGFQGASSPRPTSADNYVDGVSMTHGMNYSQHIWSFAAGVCPCSNNKPDFVGDKFSCDGIHYAQCSGFCNEVLWDGVGCGNQTTPWIYRRLPQSTTDDIQMRVCRDQIRLDEDIAIEKIEIFIQ